jgi:Transposase IS66 family
MALAFSDCGEQTGEFRRTSCRVCEVVVAAPAPDHAIARGRAGAGLLAHIVVSKYDDHLPLYRQAEIFARDGVSLFWRDELAPVAYRCDPSIIDPATDPVQFQQWTWILFKRRRRRARAIVASQTLAMHRDRHLCTQHISRGPVTAAPTNGFPYRSIPLFNSFKAYSGIFTS